MLFAYLYLYLYITYIYRKIAGFVKNSSNY